MNKQIQAAIGDVRPSEFQGRFLEWIAEGAGSGVLRAVAGSGKTFTLRLGTKVIKALWPDVSVAVCVFARRNAEEMKGTFPEGIYTGTQHSMAFGAYKRSIKGAVKVDKDKVWSLIDEVIDGIAKGNEEKRDGVRRAYGAFVRKLVGLAKGEGIGYLVPDEPAEWARIIDQHDLWLESENATEESAISIAQRVLARNNAMIDIIDFDDMLYLTLVGNVRLYQNDWVFVDEAQDTNAVQRALLRRMVKPGGRLVAVGDDSQAIFGFRGASADALDKIREEWNAEVMPLTVSYRCCKAAAAIAARIVPEFEAHADNPDGEQSDLPELPISKLAGGDAVLCRKTAPLVDTAYQLIGRGVGAKLVGREIGEGLISVIKRMKAKGIDALGAKLGMWRDREVAKATAKGNESKAEAVVDKHDAIAAVIDYLGENERTIPALVRKIESMFEDDVDGDKRIVRLSTIHRAKGLEWDRVYIQEAGSIPSPFARQAWQLDQERNLAYVAATRAKKELVICGGWNY